MICKAMTGWFHSSETVPLSVWPFIQTFFVLSSSSAERGKLPHLLSVYASAAR